MNDGWIPRRFSLLGARRRRASVAAKGEDFLPTSASSSRTSSHPRARARVARAGFARGAVVRAVGAVARADVRDRLLDPAQPPRAPRVPAAAARVAVAVVVAARGVAAAHDDGRAETGVGARAGARPRRRARAAWEMRPERIGSPDEASLKNGSAREDYKTGRVGWRAARVPFSACAVQHGRPQWVARVSISAAPLSHVARALHRCARLRGAPHRVRPSRPRRASRRAVLPARSRRLASSAVAEMVRQPRRDGDRTRASPENLARRSASATSLARPRTHPPSERAPSPPFSPLPHALCRPRERASPDRFRRHGSHRQGHGAEDGGDRAPRCSPPRASTCASPRAADSSR